MAGGGCRHSCRAGGPQVHTACEYVAVAVAVVLDVILAVAVAVAGRPHSLSEGYHCLGGHRCALVHV